MNRPPAPILAVLMLGWVHVGFAQDSDDFGKRRETMVRRYILGPGVTNPRVIDAMMHTPRHQFVPEDVAHKAYFDVALPIGFQQTISSPYIVARMTEQIDPQPDDRVLEVGTGSGYQAAVLSPLVRDVYTIEIVPELGKRAEQTLQRLQYQNVHVRIGDGYKGWARHAPFDKIIVTCSPENIPQPLVDQLAEGGRLVVPLGKRFQQVLYRFNKLGGELKRERLEATFFVPMTGRAERERNDTDMPLSIVNGSFEDRTVDSLEPLGWYYIRRGQVVEDSTSPRGKHCLTLANRHDGPTHALQPFGIDGRTTKRLRIDFWSRGKNIRSGLVALQTSQLVVEFYNEQRAAVGEDAVSVRTGSFDWQQQSATMNVPENARLAVIGLGLFGVSGEISFDDVRISAER